MLAVARLVGREDMVERAVFAHDDDDVLDRAVGLAVVGMSSADRAVSPRKRCVPISDKIAAVTTVRSRNRFVVA